ncbi:MAG: arylesterase [Pseudomonadota bacterium]
MHQTLAKTVRRKTVRRLTIFAAAAAALLAAQAAKADQITIMALGDSLTAGFGLEPGEGFPDRLEAALIEKGYDVRVLDAGVSGDTTSGGLARLDWSMDPETDAVIVELGGNDALRGIPPEVSEESLTGILDNLQNRNLPTLLTGMLAPPNMGAAYGEAFNGIYPRLAKTYDVIFYPFFLDGVAGEPQLNLPDGIHPTAAGVDLIVSRILPYVEELISRVEAQS